MAATTVTVKLDEVYDAMRACLRASLVSGRNWHAVTVGADGVPYCREEVSRCVSESEYFGKGEPYPVTVYSVQGSSHFESRVEDIDSEVDAFDPVEQYVDPFHGSENALVAKLETAGFTVEA